MNNAPLAFTDKRRATAWLMAIGVAYLGTLWWIDRDKHLLQRVLTLALPLGAAVVPVLLSYLVRYARWRWLLHRQGERFPWVAGLLAYLGGFAFTATPGKVGELIRIRHYARLGVRPERTFATFLFERSLDLLVILTLSLAVASYVPAFGLFAASVLALLLVLSLLASWPCLGLRLEALTLRLPACVVRRLMLFMLRGMRDLRPFLHLAEGVVGLTLGAVAWLLTSITFVWLCEAMGFQLPVAAALGIYPLAMLVGALSFVPGGVGTTELAIVLMLGRHGVATEEAVVAAIGIRLVTLWFAVAIGLLTTGLLERSANAATSEE